MPLDFLNIQIKYFFFGMRHKLGFTSFLKDFTLPYCIFTYVKMFRQ